MPHNGGGDVHRLGQTLFHVPFIIPQPAHIQIIISGSDLLTGEAAEAALFALEHTSVFESQAQDIRSQRTFLLSELLHLPDVRVFPSEANMILLRVSDAQKTFSGLCSRGVLIKNVSKMHPLLLNCLRLTVGTEPENRLLLAALRASL